MTRIACRNCGATVSQPAKGRRKRYCDRHCATQYLATKQLKLPSYKRRVVECRVCKQPFNPVNDRHHICSAACRVASQRTAYRDNPSARPNIFQVEKEKQFITDQIIERAANKRAALPPKPVKRRGPDPKTAARKARHAALKAKWKQDRDAVKQTRAARNAARVSPAIAHLRDFVP